MLQGFLVALVATLIYMESRIGGQHMLEVTGNREVKIYLRFDHG